MSEHKHTTEELTKLLSDYAAMEKILGEANGPGYASSEHVFRQASVRLLTLSAEVKRLREATS